MKEVRFNRLHLFEMARTGKFIETECRQKVPGAGGWKEASLQMDTKNLLCCIEMF